MSREKYIMSKENSTITCIVCSINVDVNTYNHKCTYRNVLNNTQIDKSSKYNVVKICVKKK